MAKNEVAETRKGGKGVAKWDAELAKFAKEDGDREKTPVGQFISVRGGRITIGGNTLKEDSIDVVVLDFVFENDYYVGKFDPKKPRSPVCYAMAHKEDDMKPHEKSEDPQSKSCNGCKWNEFGSSKRGKGKACKNIRRLALLSADGLDADSLKTGAIQYLRVPVTSTKGWAHYAKGLSTNYGLPAFAVITTITVTPDEDDQFKVSFQMKEPLDKKLIPHALKRRGEVSEQIMFPYAGSSEDDGKGKGKGGKKDKDADDGDKKPKRKF